GSRSAVALRIPPAAPVMIPILLTAAPFLFARIPRSIMFEVVASCNAVSCGRLKIKGAASPERNRNPAGRAWPDKPGWTIGDVQPGDVQPQRLEGSPYTVDKGSAKA